MASSKRRKTAALALAFVGVAGLSIASAAQLNLGTGSLGAGTTVVAGCQPAATPIGVGFENAFSAAEYKTTSVALKAVDAACVGLKYKVTLTDSAGVAIGTELTGTIAAAGVLTIPVTPSASARAITGVAVVIYS
ncbi:hypothetical protein SAMN05216410_3140 [Sanguibacter gelidistatuariae]|uniref:Uncharacterized protein n=1 Tax=Sanguibacter gelidistatuariae TaxID=1814289 RepID=A0A1G6TN46_9MICO|nr:hypothetical protein [Sanguibacter gelidistatuariae]SDD29906.1 hypothetical protein SAMN05216410_3140 [Sanguibacter gelidistatuariae]